MYQSNIILLINIPYTQADKQTIFYESSRMFNSFSIDNWEIHGFVLINDISDQCICDIFYIS